MTYPEIILLVFLYMAFPFLIVGGICAVLTNLSLPKRLKRKLKPSRQALMCENTFIKEENTNLRRQNKILMQEIKRLRGI